MNYCTTILTAILFATFAKAQGTLSFELIAEGLSAPVAMANDGVNSERIYVVERDGVIKIIDLQTGVVSPTNFLDISALVDSGGEKGMLGLTFHPNYPGSPYFYVNYTFDDAGQLTTKVARYTVAGEIADAISEEVIIQISQPFSNHNAGDLKFGPDGYLYIPMGDGGSGRDPDNYSQDPLTLLGTMLRLDVDDDDFPSDPLRNYAIPADNPFVGVSTHLPEIWSFGWRNPWRFSFDSSTGDMWVADVGQSSREEISYESAGSIGGGNYGWSCREGFLDVNYNPCYPGILIDPIYDMNRDNAQSITGGYVYRGDAFPTLHGFYFAADFASGEWWQINATDFTDVTQTSELFSVTTFGTSVNEELYCATISGSIYRIMDGDACTDVLTITTHPNDAYLADTEITSTATVDEGRSITYSSPLISMDAQFEVTRNGEFVALALSCIDYLLQVKF